MKKQYAIVWRGYQAPWVTCNTKAEACDLLKGSIDADVERAPYKVVKIRHSATHYETKIGSRQGCHTYSEGWIIEV